VGSELSAMTRNVGDSAPVDVAKVERVRAALADGSFKFDAGTTASRLIQIESLLGPR
jgi:negative regulator of flagellin synthesis FlgM